MELTALLPLWIVMAGADRHLLCLEMFFEREWPQGFCRLWPLLLLILGLGADFSLLAHQGMPGALFNRLSGD